MSINKTDLIKELRAITAAGMKDCKDALVESNYDLQAAVDLIKTKGLNIVSGREGKVASEGAVAVSEYGPCSLAAMVECNSNTDFCSNSKEFRAFVRLTATAIHNTIAAGNTFDVAQVEPERLQLVSTVKENIVVRRWWVEEALDSKAKVFTYVHSNAKIGVLLTLLAGSEEAANSQDFTELGNTLAMQVAAMSPLSVDKDRLDPDVVARQTAIFETQLEELNKPKAAWAKILEGKLNKYYADVCLLNQESVFSTKKTIQQVIDEVSSKLGCEVKVVSFVRVVAGEGIEQEKKPSLAEEVSNMTGVK